MIMPNETIELNDRPHPGPLPQEKENRSPASRFRGASSGLLDFHIELPKRGGRQIDLQTIGDDQRLSPLPGGEGQGEGERPN